MTEVHEDAIVCPSCGAQKGYYAGRRGLVHDRRAVNLAGWIFAGIAIASIAFLGGTTLGTVLTLFFGVLAATNWWRVARGPRWFR